MKNNENPLDVFRAEWRQYGANLAGGLSPELTFVDDHGQHRRHLLYRNAVMLIAMAVTAAVATASTPIPDGRAMSDVPSRAETLALSNQLIAAL